MPSFAIPKFIILLEPLWVSAVFCFCQQVQKIPQMLLERCEFGKADYNLNIVHPPVYDDCDEEEEDV